MRGQRPSRTTVVASVALIGLFACAPTARADLFQIVPRGVPVSSLSYRTAALPSTLPSFYTAPPTGVFNTVLNQSTSTLNLASTYTAGAGFSYTVGTSPSSNPALYLDFNGGGLINYTYDLPMSVDHQAPTQVVAGHTYTIDPFLTLNGTPTLSAAQTIDFGTSFNFGLEVELPSILPDIDLDVSVDIPNVSFGGVSVTAEGTGSIGTSGSTVIDRSAEGPGYFTVATNERSMDAWEVSADLIALASHLGVPGMGLVNLLGFDLDLALGMPIFREDSLALWNYEFADTSIVVPETRPDGSAWEAGDTFTYEVDTTLVYDLLFQSDYDFGGSISMEFDAPFVDPVEIFDQSLGQFDVATVYRPLFGLTQEVTIRGQATIADPLDCRTLPDGRVACSMPYLLAWSPSTSSGVAPSAPPDGTSSEIAYMEVASEEFVQLYQETVPEPATLVLLGTGLGTLGLAARRRRR